MGTDKYGIKLLVCTMVLKRSANLLEEYSIVALDRYINSIPATP